MTLTLRVSLVVSAAGPENWPNNSVTKTTEIGLICFDGVRVSVCLSSALDCSQFISSVASFFQLTHNSNV